MAVTVAMVLLVSKTQLAVVILPKDAYAHNFRRISVDFLSVSQVSAQPAISGSEGDEAHQHNPARTDIWLYSIVVSKPV